MKGRKQIIFLSLALFCILAFPLFPVRAQDITLSEEAQACLKCHAKRGIVKKFENGESVAAYVDPENFKVSAHNSLSCSHCHVDFSVDKHPERRFRSKEQYKIKSSLVCSRCHKDAQVRANPVHAGLFKEGKIHICANCHGSHSIMRVAGGRKFTNEEQYCLSCHGHAASLTFKNGETLPLAIDKSVLEGSVHNKLSCSDCHYGFSSEGHPQRNFRSRREYTLASSETCRRCHFDKYTKTMESIHYTMLSQGNLKAPVCTDCHGNHGIQAGRVEKALSGKRCRKCHENIFTIYASSVHGKALMDENNQDVPICVDCHMAHDIRNPLTLEYHERIPELCSNCHANKAIVGKYGLSTDVVKTYLSDFHGVTLGFYKKQREALYKPARPIAVCTDCHGTHNIVSSKGTDAVLLKANLVKRCRQCHPNATKNFPDTWLSHYEPSIKTAPLVFIVNLMYKIFIPVLVIGLFLQILLHIWRYAVNR